MYTAAFPPAPAALAAAESLRLSPPFVASLAGGATYDDCVLHNATIELTSSASFLAETSVRSPRKLFIFTV